MIEILKQKYNYYWAKSEPWLRQELERLDTGLNSASKKGSSES